MIPLRDDNPTSRVPVVTLLLIATNLAVFVYQAHFAKIGYEASILAYGLIPGELTHSVLVQIPHRFPIPLLTIFTAMFMHGGIMHLVGNMWFLWIFGDNVEDRLGRTRFLIFYLVTGVVAFLAHVIISPRSTMPLVGASGAIAGILGGYFLMFPRHRILTLIPIFFFITTAHVPAAFFLGLWFLMQVLMSGQGGQIAWWAHIGGFAAGVVLVLFFRQRR